MESNHAEYGIPMPPVSWAALESFAEVVASQFFSYTLMKPTVINFKQLMNFTMPFNGFEIYPADYAELPGRYGVTCPTTDKARHVILLRHDLWDEIDIFGGTSAHLAKATLLHEFSHALLNHDYRIGRIEKQPKQFALLARKKLSTIKIFENAENQAWCLAGNLAMPRKTLEMIPGAGVSEISHIYGVSTEFVQSHLRRLKMIRPMVGDGSCVMF